MFHYNPSSFTFSSPSHLPRRSYPASFYQYGEPSDLPSFSLEDLGYSSMPPTFQPRSDPETRYRRALSELEAAEQEYEAHVALVRAREVAAARQRAAAAEAIRRERARAVQDEIERVEHRRALQALVEQRLAQRQHPLQPRAPVPCQGRGFHPALADADPREEFVPRRRFGGCRRSPSHCMPCPARRNNATPGFGDFWELLTDDHSGPEPANSPQEPTPPTAPQPQPQPEPEPEPQSSSQPQSQPQSEPKPAESEDSDEEITLNDILEFIQGIATQFRDATGKAQSSQQPDAPSQTEATPVDEKGKGKAKAEAAPQPTLFQTLFGERMNGSFDQEMRDLEEAIKLSVQDPDATDAKKARASETASSSPGASSSKVGIEVPSPSGRAASPAHSATSNSTRTVVPQPVSPLTTIRTARSQFSALESAFKFPPVLDFDHTELANTPNNAPVRAYEQALNRILEQLDAIESDGDEEVREVRREVVREVEMALEDVERKVQERAPHQTPVPEVTMEEVKGYEVESRSEEPQVPVTEDVLPVGVSPAVEDTRPALPDPAPIASPADADIDMAIYEEYRSASPVTGSSEMVVADAEVAAPAITDPSDSIATISPAIPAAPVPIPAPGTSDPETFLTSMTPDQFTFPPKPSQSSTSPGEAHDDAVFVDASSDGESGSMKGAEDGWSEVHA